MLLVFCFFVQLWSVARSISTYTILDYNMYGSNGVQPKSGGPPVWPPDAVTVMQARLSFSLVYLLIVDFFLLASQNFIIVS